MDPTAVEAGSSRGLYLQLLLGAAILFYVARPLVVAVTDPLRRVPGPLAARFTKLWLVRQYVKGDFHRTNRQLHAEYGPIVRIAPGYYSVDDFEASKQLYGHGTKFTKSNWYDTWAEPSWNNVFNERDPHIHAQDRRKLASSYAMSALLAYESGVDQCREILEQSLTLKAKMSASIDLPRLAQFMAFDVICQISFNKIPGFVAKESDIDGCIETLDTRLFMSTVGGLFPRLHRGVLKTFQFLGLPNPMTKHLLKWVDHEIDRRRQEKSSGGNFNSTSSDMVSTLLSAAENQSGRITDTEVQRAAMMNVFAGSDTTSIALTSILFHVYRNPKHLERLRQELEEAVQNGTASENITFQEAQKLPFLQAVIKEGMRVFPSVALPMPRVVPAEGCNIAGVEIPAGTVVGINPWVAHANKDVFGPDAESFEPDRWLGEKTSMQDAYNLTFGAGSRTCLGKNISLLEISKIVPMIVRRFDLNFGDVTELEGLNRWFVKADKVFARVTFASK
ncbi:Pisatin demethylase [Cercospora beticola]|uniref:Pisatin demethylase n=1 Tax=Cercospora beticola TaxID=122368 RepID=A0A2G5HHS0_CERBT|nr:Pisatin demethylase [Cercospora beticola]PIA92088.1 Pisatin demethylase [Cercospora beticola]WPB06692.1 hypothetical protein RHO25_011351 [Cercospora beticola]CAK1366607.1 unnamed protein product [Cercospora beticola]